MGGKRGGGGRGKKWTKPCMHIWIKKKKKKKKNTPPKKGATKVAKQKKTTPSTIEANNLSIHTLV
jgi:hypothetical protein